MRSDRKDTWQGSVKDCWSAVESSGPSSPFHFQKCHRSLLTSFNLSELLSFCNLTFSHRCKWENNGRKKRSLTRGAGKERMEGEKRRLLPCFVLLLIPPLLHTETFDTFQWLSSTLPVTPTLSGLHKLTQHGRTHSHACSVPSLCPLCFWDSMKSALHWRLEDSRLLHPRFSFLLAFIHSPCTTPPTYTHTQRGPYGLCVDRWPVASLEVGLYRVQHSQGGRMFRVLLNA